MEGSGYADCIGMVTPELATFLFAGAEPEWLSGNPAVLSAAIFIGEEQHIQQAPPEKDGIPEGGKEIPEGKKGMVGMIPCEVCLQMFCG